MYLILKPYKKKNWQQIENKNKISITIFAGPLIDVWLFFYCKYLYMSEIIINKIGYNKSKTIVRNPCQKANQ